MHHPVERRVTIFENKDPETLSERSLVPQFVSETVLICGDTVTKSKLSSSRDDQRQRPEVSV